MLSRELARRDLCLKSWLMSQPIWEIDRRWAGFIKVLNGLFMLGNIYACQMQSHIIDGNASEAVREAVSGARISLVR